MRLTTAFLLSLALCAATLCATAAATAAKPSKVDFYVVAHADDWQLFMGDRAYADIRDKHKVVFVYASAGDANLGADYWHTRESAANASAQFVVDLPTADVVGRGTSACSTQQVGGHPLQRCVYGNTVSYFMRLPDGNLDGAGFENNRFQSLKKLREGGIDSIAALDGTSTYKGWADFHQTIREIIKTESDKRAPRDVSVHTQEHDPALTPSDHSDHMMTGLAVAEAVKGTSLGARYYVGYDIKKRPPNLSSAASMYKSGVFMVYERTMQSKAQKTTFCELPVSYSSWLFRTYYRTADGGERPRASSPR
jgi:hypothetical protein